MGWLGESPESLPGARKVQSGSHIPETPSGEKERASRNAVFFPKPGLASLNIPEDAREKRCTSTREALVEKRALKQPPDYSDP
jgi:hypothetical protein